MNQSLRRLLTVLLSAVFLVTTGVTVLKLIAYHTSDRSAEAAKEVAQQSPQPAPPPPEEAPSEEAPYLDLLADDETAAALRSLDFDALRAVNSDVIGWVLIPDTPIDYPLLQTDSNEYYLTHTWERAYNDGGSIFMEQLCRPDFSGFNTILYGHRMRNDSMFGSLKYYKDEDYRAAHPSVYVATPEAVRRYEVFAAFEPAVTDPPYRVGDFSGEQRQTFLDYSAARSVLSAEDFPTVEDQILTLSTCTGHGHTTRWVVQARLLAASLVADSPAR